MSAVVHLSLVVALIVAAAATVVVAPLVLSGRPWQVRHPRAALLLWCSLFLLGAVALAGSIVICVLCALFDARAGSPAVSIVVTVSAWTLLGVVGGLAALAVSAAEPLSESTRQQVRRRAPVAIERIERAGFVLVRYRADEPVAFAVRGDRPEIFVSTGLEATLSGAERAAVVAHEYAHLRQRHGLLLRVAEINAICLPRFLRAGAAMKRSVSFLVELVADDTAARQVGPAALANALSTLGRETGDPSCLLRAERLTLRRWPRARRRRVPRALAGLADG